MVTMKRNRKQFWVRHFDETDDGIRIYSSPHLIRLNLFPTNAESDLMSLGADYTEYMRARISLTEAKRYGVEDLIYESEPKFDSIADIGNATYRITAMLPILNVTEILCRRVSGAK